MYDRVNRGEASWQVLFVVVCVRVCARSVKESAWQRDATIPPQTLTPSSHAEGEEVA